jgi:hypothetical protein
MVRGIEVLASVGDMLERDPITIVNGPDLSAEHGVRSLLWVLLHFVGPIKPAHDMTASSQGSSRDVLLQGVTHEGYQPRSVILILNKSQRRLAYTSMLCDRQDRV